MWCLMLRQFGSIAADGGLCERCGQLSLEGCGWFAWTDCVPPPPRGANCLRGCCMTLRAGTRRKRATTTSTLNTGGRRRLSDRAACAARWTVSSRLGFIPNTHWQLGRTIDVPLGGTISRYGSTGFYSGILHVLASALVTYFTAINCDFKQHFRTGLHVTT